MAKAVLTARTDAYTGFISTNIGGVLLRKKPTDNSILQKSTDNNANWSDVYNFIDALQYAVLLASGTYIVSTNSANVFDATPGEIWRSSDNGSTFTKVLTLDSGTAIFWSIAHSSSAIFVGEYGFYPSRNVWRSTDDGATWAKSLTIPDESGNVHIHNINIDPDDHNNIIVGTGDVTNYIYFSGNNGETWTQIVDDKQITSAVFHNGYIILFSDESNGNIYRDTIANFKANTPNIQTVYDGVANGYPCQYYAATKDSYGRIYGGGLDEGFSARGPAVLIVSDDNGETWEILKEYPQDDGTSWGVYQLSDGTLSSNNKIYLASIQAPAIIDFFEEISQVNLKGTITIN